LGIISEEDLSKTRAQTATAALKVAKIMEITIQEEGAMRHALALPLSAKIKFKKETLPATSWESMDPEAALPGVLLIAPEFKQLEHLRDAAKADKWTKIFGFINTSTLSTSSFPGPDGHFSNASLSRLIGTERVGLGFSYIPSIRLSEGNMKELELQTEEMKLQQANVLEVTIQQIVRAKDELNQAEIAEAGFKKVFEIKEKRFNLGSETLFGLLYARVQATEAAIETIRAHGHLNMLRISLDRATLSGYFEAIGGCLANEPPVKEEGFFIWNWIKNIFVSSDEVRADLEKQLDRVCNAS
ncbi:MAG: TolC family protein, partial [Bdellovibrionota bacterium]